VAIQRYVVHGVGSGYLINSDGSFSPFMEMEDMSISINTTVDNVFGGDGLLPIMQFVKEKTAQFTFTSATFGLDMLAISQGVAVTAGGGASVFTDEIVTPATGSAQLTITTGVDITSVSAVDTTPVTGSVLTKVTGVPAAGQYAVLATGAMTFNTAQNGKAIEVNYCYSDATSNSVDVLTTSVPGFVELRHKSNIIDDGIGGQYVLYSRIYRARSDGKINVDMKRAAAYAPKMTFESLDPQRSDKKFASFVMKKVN